MVTTEQRLGGHHAIVTGASRGIGAAIATALATQGASVSLMGRDMARLSQTASSLALPERVTAIQIDVTDAASVQKAVSAARSRFGRIDMLINNAGQAFSAPFLKTDEAAWRRMLDVNLTGAYHCIQAVLADMKQAGWGRIVNIASTAGLRGYAYTAAYVASKHGLVGLTRALALEVAQTGITVNAVCPGFTDTDIVRDAIANVVKTTGRTADEARAVLLSSNPQKRLIQPEEVAQAVAWLCTPGAQSVTGQSIAIAGGEVM